MGGGLRRYPSDFLALIGRTPLQAEPEVLGGEDTHDVPLVGMLIRGSRWRCPRGIWASDLALHASPQRNAAGLVVGEPADEAARHGRHH